MTPLPGFPSAARFVAQAFADANLDNAALPGVYVGVVMGRHAGFLTAASALGKKFPDDGPHLIYLPERTFVLEKFLADVKNTYERYGRCVSAACLTLTSAKHARWARRPCSLPWEARVLEDEFIAASGTDVTEAFRMYLLPLLGSGMPDAFRLRYNLVAKVLHTSN